MKTINFLSFILATIFILSCEEIETVLDAIVGWTDPNSFYYNEEATESNGSCLSMIGCLGYAAGYTNSGKVINTLKDPFFDQKTFEEETYLENLTEEYIISLYPKPK